MLKEKRGKAATKEWLAKLPVLVRHLEDRLFREAPSLQHYFNKDTVKMRLQKIAIGRSRSNRPESSSDAAASKASASKSAIKSSPRNRPRENERSECWHREQVGVGKAL